MTMSKALALLALLLLLAPSPVEARTDLCAGDFGRHLEQLSEGAENGIVVIDVGVEKDFPEQATFTVEAHSAADIVDVRLRYVVDKMKYAEVVSEGRADFTPAIVIEATWVWDMRQASLPPGAEVSYWWVIEDAEGNRFQTAPESMSFDDDRYDWRSLTGGGPQPDPGNAQGGEVTLFWYLGDDAFAEGLMAVCEEGMVRLVDEIGTYPERPIRIYIYASSEDLRGAMIFPQEWTGGVAYTEFSTIAIGISPDRREWGERALIHELTHLVVHQATFSPYGRLPTWLDEGLAMYNEGELESHFRSRLETAIAEGKLISVRSLCSPFSAVPDLAYLSYAQSYSLAAYLLDKYGKDRMLDLLAVLKEGATYDDAMIQVYGFDIDGLDANWRASLGNTALSAQRERSLPAAAMVSGALAAVVAIIGILIWRRRVRRLAVGTLSEECSP